MASRFHKGVDSLAKIANRFDKQSNRDRLDLILILSRAALKPDDKLERYVNLLLHSLAFATDKTTWQAAVRELSRVGNVLQKLRIDRKTKLKNSGMPFTDLVSTFTYDFFKWISQQRGLAVSIDRIDGTDAAVNDTIGAVLPSLIRSDTTAGYTVDELFDALDVPPGRRLKFILDLFNKIDGEPFVRDLLFEKLAVWLRITPTEKRWSIPFNRLSLAKPYFHDEFLRKFDHAELVDRPIQSRITITGQARKELIRVIKAAMMLTDRETDTVTYMDERSVRFYRLDRGIAVAIYGMTPDRQMPLESYVGYTLFKNGWPAAYGGGWVFGRRCGFGINIFEPYRGGESGYMFCQLLRVYAQVFGVRFFEVESFQFGEDNAEGIASGAFWFYYRHGFRPTEQSLKKLAEREFKLGKSRPTSTKVLEQLATCNLVLNLGGKTPMSVYDVTRRVKRMIRWNYANDVATAIRDCSTTLLHTSGHAVSSKLDSRVLGEFALWASAFRIRDKQKLSLLIQLVETKPVNVYKYQELLLKFLND